MADRELEILISAKNLAKKTLDNVAKQLEEVEKKTKEAEEATKKFAKTRKLLASMKKNWLAVTAAIAGSLLALKGAFNLAEKAAKFDQAQKAFTNVAESFGANASAMITDLKRVSGQTLSTAQIMESAGNAMILGIPAERLEKMMEIARASSRITGQTVQKSFEDIALGVGRGSKMILDNLGIMLDVDKANQAYAKSIGKTVAQLSDADRKTAFLNATMEAGDVIINRIGVDTLSSAEKFQKFSSNIDELQILMGKAFAKIGGTVAGVFLPLMDKTINALNDFFAGLEAADDTWDKLDKRIVAARQEIQALADVGITSGKGFENAERKLAEAIANKNEFLKKSIDRQKELNDEKKKGKDADTEAVEPEFMAGGIEDPRIKLGQESEIVLITQRAIANEQKLEQLRAFHTMELDLAAQHGADLDELTRISALQDREEAEHTAQFRMKTAASAAGALSNIAQNLNTALGGKSKKAFKVMQAAAIAQTAIDTSRAAMGAYASLATIPVVGPALGIAAAAAAVAAGAAQINQIKSQQFGGGGSVSIGGGANPTRTGGGASAQGVPVRLEEEDRRGKQEINITFQADGIIAADTLSQMSENIIKTINDAGDRNLLINAKAIAG